MNNLDKNYLNLVKDVLENGHDKGDRTGTGTRSVFGRQIRHKMSDGFPLLTTKKMYMKGIITELLWFLRGDTNIKYLVDNNCHIWDGDAAKNYINAMGFNWRGAVNPKFAYDSLVNQFVDNIKNSPEFAEEWGDLGPIYGKQWRKWGTNKLESFSGVDYDGCKPIYIDQIKNSIELLKTDPDSRRNIVSAWNVGEMKDMVLPPCHNFFQFYTRELTLEERIKIWDEIHLKNVKFEDSMDNIDLDGDGIPKRAISLMWNQRSVNDKSAA